MLTAILSDIHSNIEALERVCTHAQALGAGRYVCLGDVVGYGADPGAVLDRLMALPNLIAVRGNHDEALFREAAPGTYPDIVESLAWTRARLTPAQLDFLDALPFIRRDGAATYVHANAHAPQQWEYLWQPEQMHACMEAAGTPVTFIGHVHVPRVFHETAGGRVREFTPADGVPVPLSAQTRYVINVGSVGQPRDGNNAASYVLYDQQTAEVTFHRLAYDHAATSAKILAAGLSPYFANRLARGR